MDIILKDAISRLITDHATVSILLAKELKSLEIIHWSGSLGATIWLFTGHATRTARCLCSSSSLPLTPSWLEEKEINGIQVKVIVKYQLLLCWQLASSLLLLSCPREPKPRMSEMLFK